MTDTCHHQSEANMISWFLTLPLLWQLVISFVTIASVVVISIFGRLAVKKGKFTVGLGRDTIGHGEDGKNSSEKIKHSKKAKDRSCDDCYTITRHKYLQADRKIKALDESRMQKIYAQMDQKLEYFQLSMIEQYSQRLNPNVINNTNQDDCIYEAKLNEALNRVRYELKRALREDGFDKCKDDYNVYVKNEAQSVKTIIYNHLRSVYPRFGMIISKELVLQDVENSYKQIESKMFEFFDFAKEVTIQITDEINKIDKECDCDCRTIIGIKKNGM